MWKNENWRGEQCMKNMEADLLNSSLLLHWIVTSHLFLNINYFYLIFLLQSIHFQVRLS